MLSDGGDYLNAKITFAETLESPLSLHIYYADELSGFSEENTIDITVAALSNYAVFALKDFAVPINYIRIDFENTLVSVPLVDAVQIQRDTLSSRIACILLWLVDGHLLMMLAVSFILAFALVYFLANRDRNSYKCDFAAIGIMATCFFIIYFDYISGGKVFTFYDEVGSDSFIQRYSSLVSIANRISNGWWKEYIDFTRGLGNRVLGLNLNIGNIFCIFGKAGIARWLGVSYYLHVLLAGVLAYYWAKAYSDNRYISLMVAFGYAMSSEFTIRSAWYMYPYLALVLIFWLLAFELLQRKGIWYLLPFATVVFFYDINIYFCIFWGFLLACYILFRVLTDSDGAIPWKRWIKIELLYGLFAAVGMADRVLAQLLETLSSTRFTEAASDYSNSFDTFISNRAVIFSAFLRTLGQTINGISDDFSGEYQFLSDPSFYCGILFFLLIPMSVYNMGKRKKRLYIFVIVAALLYIMIVPIRVAANGFADAEFRQSSFWICIFMLILAMEILKRIFEGKDLKKGSLEIFYGSVVAPIVLLLIAAKFQYIIRIQELMISVLFIVVYGIFMRYLLFDLNKKCVMMGVLCIAVVSETLAVSWNTINDRNTITVEDLQQRKYYNDYTVDALNTIREVNKEWYRVDKSYGSVGLCDSLVQGYYGVSSYIGGVEADPGNIAIYQALELTKTDYGNHCLMGTGGNIYASALLGVKYYLSKSEIVDWYGLQYLAKIGDIFIYENKLALPLAYAYEKVITEEEFDQLSIYDRSRNILGACVVNLQNGNIKEIQPFQLEFSDLGEYQRFFELSGQFCDVDVNEDQVMIIRMNMLREGYFQTLYYIDQNGAICGESITYGTGEKVVEVSCDNLASIVFSEQMCKDIESAEFYIVDKQQYYDMLEENVTGLKDHAMEIVDHDDIYNYIEGFIICDNPSVLATSIPIRRDWKILVDGQEAEVVTVNKGFVGCYLDAGEHNIVIYYDGRSWLGANIFKLIGIIVSIGILIVGCVVPLTDSL